MKELSKTRRLTIATFVFVLVLVVGFLTFQKPEFEYILAPQEILDQISNKENEIAPALIGDILAKNNPSYVFVDLRNPYEYGRGYLGEAINIPVSEILAEESILFFEEMKENSVTLILYGKDQLEANGPWMLLQQLGFDNLKILLGGYDYILQKKNSTDNTPEQLDYQLEEPIANFAESFKNRSSTTDESANEDNAIKQIIPIKRTSKTTKAGGC